jgi:F0F1-type ATP synthase membrane subunit c/vacuolar-type H+-ATPase subunit K
MVQLFFADAASATVMSKGIMLGVAFAAAALGLALVGSNYMKALGRNPESGKAASQIIIIAAMIEVTALLAFLLGAFLLK